METNGTFELIPQISSLKKLAYLTVVSSGQKEKLQEITHIGDFDDIMT